MFAFSNRQFRDWDVIHIVLSKMSEIHRSTDRINYSNATVDERLAQRATGRHATLIRHFEQWISHKLIEVWCTGSDGPRVKYASINAQVLREFILHISKKQNRHAQTSKEPYVYVSPVQLRSVQLPTCVGEGVQQS